MITFNQAQTMRKFKRIYQGKNPGNVSQASLRGNPEFNKLAKKVKRVIFALKTHNFIGTWDFRPHLSKNGSITYSLAIRPPKHFPNN